MSETLGPITAHHMWIGERMFDATGMIGEDESLVIDHSLRDAGWAVRNVLQYGPDAIVVKPKAIRIALRATLERMLAESAAESKSGNGKLKRVGKKK